MAGSIFTIPTEERILLYLSDFQSLEKVYEAPQEVTQKEIARRVGIQRKHISRYLKKLVEEEIIIEKRCHVIGGKQRMKCYYLSLTGQRKAKQIRDYVGNKNVKILIDGNITEMLVSEIDGNTSVHLTLSDIVNEAISAENYLDRDELERIEERKRREVDERTRKADIYLKALSAAWRNGVLTPSEKHLIDALKEHLGVTDAEHDVMEAEIINNLKETKEEQQELYTDILKIVGDKPTKKEEKILEVLRNRYMI